MLKEISLSCLLTTTLCFAPISQAAATSYSEFYFFGDSLSDVGNNGCETNKDANGECMTWANDLYNIAFHTNVKPSSLGGTDYAVGGSVTADAVTQVTQYLSTHGNQADPNAYYFVLTGGNDIMNLALNTTTEIKSKLDRLAPLQALGDITKTVGNFNNNLEGKDGSLGIITHEISAIKMLETAGAKHIMVIDLPNISTTPTVQAASNSIIDSCQKSIFISKTDKPICLTIGQSLDALSEIFIRDYNDVLASDIRNNLDPQVVKTFSMFDMTQQVLSNNILNPNGTCNGTAETCRGYLFFNGIHPSAAAHQIMANKMVQVL